MKYFHIIGPKAIYAALVTKYKTPIRSQRQWETSLSVGGPEEWKDIYQRPYRTSRETRLQSFQLRVCHRTITCNKLLHRYRIKDDDKCSICDCIDSLEHFLVLCPPCEDFWRSVFRWIKAATGWDLSGLSPKETLLGVPRDYPNAHQVNFLLLVSRFFIHRQRLFHGCNLNIIHWIREVRNRLLTEKQVCQAEGKPGKFSRW